MSERVSSVQPFAGSSWVRRAGRRMRASPLYFSILLLLPSAILIGVFVVAPFFRVLVMSLQSVEMSSISGRFVGLKNYQWVVESSELRNAVVKSIIWTAGTVSLQVVLGVIFALLLNRPLMMRGLLRALTLFPYLVPTIVGVLIWRYLMHDLVGPLNYFLVSSGIISQPLLWLESPRWAMLSVIIIAAWKHFPFVVVIVLAMLQTIPQEQYEAAGIDGANEWQQFRYITLPAILPAIAIAALVRVIYEINGFDIIYLLTAGGPVDATKTLPILVYSKAFLDFQLGRAAAAATITLGLMLVILFVGTAVSFVRNRLQDAG